MKKRLLGWIMLSLMCLSSMADDISGVILKNGKPKKGITVWMKKADKAVETDKEGRFFFTNVFEGDTLQITVSAKSDAKILLRDWRQITVNLEKKKYTVNDGKSENTYEYVVLSPLRVGDGVSGVVVTSDGGSSKVQIHGISSVNSGTDPLVVLDGVALQGVDLDTLIPVEEIANLRVIKDGSGYGVRGANGVIEISTLK